MGLLQGAATGTPGESVGDGPMAQPEKASAVSAITAKNRMAKQKDEG
jgi:hypothetical protein